MNTAAHNISTCSVEGGRIAYRRAGKGEPVVLVHGVMSSSFIWLPVIPYLEDRWDVIAVDLMGCGDSDRLQGADLSIRAHAARLHEFVNAIGLNRFHLVGHDVGGGISQIFAVRHPERLHSLTLVNTVAYDFWPVQPIIAVRTPFLRQLAMATLDIGMLRLIVRRALHHKDRLTPELFARFHREVSARGSRRSFLRFTRSLDNAHLLEISVDLRRLSVPTLVIRGEQDVYLSVEISRRLNREIPGSRLVTVGEAGHFIQIDQPEQLADHLIQHLSEASSG
ncbi:MAG: alpha/beta hydrolase [Acidobacteria bacterium]|nr:alpha/beta hydrolase [Acidobacteriota bacterium]